METLTHELVLYQKLFCAFSHKIQTKETFRSLRLEPFPEFINLLQMNLWQVIKTFQFVLVINVNDQVTA